MLDDQKKQRIIEVGQTIINSNPRIPRTKLIKQAVEEVSPGERIRVSFSWFMDAIHRPEINEIESRIDRLIDTVRTLEALMLEIGCKLETKTDKKKVKLPRIAVVGLIGKQSGRVLNATKDIADVTCFNTVELAYTKGFYGYGYVIASRHMRHAVTEKAEKQIGKENVVFLDSTNIGVIISTIENYVKALQ